MREKRPTPPAQRSRLLIGGFLLVWTLSAGAGEGETPERIYRIVLDGCRQLPARLVRSILRQKPTPWYLRQVKEGGYDPFWAKEDQKRIEKYYQSRGFYSVQVSEPEVSRDPRGRGVIITYHIQEGTPVRVTRLEVEFVDGVHELDDLETTRRLITLQEGERFELEQYQRSARAVAEYYQNEAFYRVVVDRSAEVDPGAGTAVVKYRITKGERYRIRSITIEGCDQTEPEVVRRCLTIAEKTRYRRAEILENQRRIQRLPIYQSVRIEESADDAAHRIDLTVRVVEAEPQLIKLGVGYGSEEYFRAQAYWQHLNFFGGARQLSVLARWSLLLEREEVVFIQPNLRRPGDFVQFTARREVETEDTYRHEALAFSPTYHFILTKYLWAELSYHLEDNRLSQIERLGDIELEDLAREGLLSAISGRLEWADLDDPIRPTRGARAGLSLEYAGGPLGGDFSYVKVVGEARGYWPLGPVVGALKWKLGWAEPLADLDQIPLFKRFYAGGTGSVRGFDRRSLGPRDVDDDPLGGAKLWEGSLELRFPLWEEFSGVVFLDSGWVWLEHEPYDPSDILYSAGAGLRWDTVIGPVAFDLAFPLTGRAEYAGLKFHFNIGHAF